MKSARFAFVAFAALLAAGCAQSLPEPQPSMQTIQTLRGSDLPGLQVGEFTLGPGVRSTKSVTIRSVVLSPAGDDTLAAYLQKTLQNDLRMSGKLDTKSDLVVRGQLTDSQVSAGIDDGTASLAAKFSLLKADKVVFEKDLSVDSKWDSSFLGAVAIPEAMNQYTALYDKLVGKLLTDEDFRAAARKQ